MDEQRPPIKTCSISDINCWRVNSLRLHLSRSTMSVTDRTVVATPLQAFGEAVHCRELVAIFSSWYLIVEEWLKKYIVESSIFW